MKEIFEEKLQSKEKTMKVYLLLILTVAFVGCAKTEPTPNKPLSNAGSNGNVVTTASNEIEPPEPVIQKSNSNSNSAAKTQTTVDPKKNIFTATELAALFKAHPDEAEKAYYTKVITIKGRVLKADDKGNSFKFRTEPPGNEGIEDWDVIASDFLARDTAKVANFKPGQEVTVKCKVYFRNDAGIAMNSCDLQ